MIGNRHAVLSGVVCGAEGFTLTLTTALRSRCCEDAHVTDERPLGALGTE